MTVRLPPLEGGRNFRDMGGYPTRDGRTVRWGMLYRSGRLTGLTPQDLLHLRTLGLRSLCDLRTTEEREHEPCRWHEEHGIGYWARDYETSFGELRRVLASAEPSVEATRAAMIAGYRQAPVEQAPAHRAIFERIAAGEVPMLFNCTAGKDRTGTAAAILLSALGVPRDIVIEDYAMSDKVVDYRRMFSAQDDDSSSVRRLPPGVVDAALASDPDYIAAALDAVHEAHGTIEAYAETVLGITPAELDRIRDRLLE
jgi:protein-tyrosine phosphatase